MTVKEVLEHGGTYDIKYYFSGKCAKCGNTFRELDEDYSFEGISSNNAAVEFGELDWILDEDVEEMQEHTLTVESSYPDDFIVCRACEKGITDRDTVIRLLDECALVDDSIWKIMREFLENNLKKREV